MEFSNIRGEKLLLEVIGTLLQDEIHHRLSIAGVIASINCQGCSFSNNNTVCPSLYIPKSLLQINRFTTLSRFIACLNNSKATPLAPSCGRTYGNSCNIVSKRLCYPGM